MIATIQVVITNSRRKKQYPINNNLPQIQPISPTGEHINSISQTTTLQYKSSKNDVAITNNNLITNNPRNHATERISPNNA